MIEIKVIGQCRKSRGAVWGVNLRLPHGSIRYDS